MRFTLLAIVVTAVVASDLNLDLTFTDCGSASAHAKIDQCSPSKIIPEQKTKVTCHGRVLETVTKANFDIKMTGYYPGLLQCSGNASQSKTCISPLGFTNQTFHAMEFPLQPSHELEVNLDVSFLAYTQGQQETMYTTTVTKATDQNGKELFCIKMKSAPVTEKCLPDGAHCVDKPDPYGCDYTCCSQYWHEECTPVSRGGEKCSRYCAPFPTLAQKGNTSQAMATPQQDTAGSSIMVV